MGGKLGIETTVHLKVEKEILPLLTIPMSDVVPEALDPSVVDTTVLIYQTTYRRIDRTR